MGFWRINCSKTSKAERIKLPNFKIFTGVYNKSNKNPDTYIIGTTRNPTNESI